MTTAAGTFDSASNKAHDDEQVSTSEEEHFGSEDPTEPEALVVEHSLECVCLNEVTVDPAKGFSWQAEDQQGLYMLGKFMQPLRGTAEFDLR